MQHSHLKKQKGVFAIEFALGFLVLFMFTMLIFEACRLTYICAVLDYTAAEAARDTRVQLHKNQDFAKYVGKNCATDVPANEKQKCQQIQSFSNNQFTIWFQSFINEKGGKLWEVFTANNKMTVTSRHYKNLHELTIDSPNATWKNNAISLYEVNYQYQPLFFRWSLSDSTIKRHVLVIDEFERKKSANK